MAIDKSNANEDLQHEACPLKLLQRIHKQHKHVMAEEEAPAVKQVTKAELDAFLFPPSIYNTIPKCFIPDDVKAFGQLLHMVMVRGEVNGVDVRRVQISIRDIQKYQAIAAGMEAGDLRDLKFRFWSSPKASRPASRPAAQSKGETPAPPSTSLDTSDMDNRTLARIAQMLLDPTTS